MKKSKLFLSMISLCFSLAVLCFGVYAANQINYQISGNISYLVSDVYMNVQTKLYYSATYMEQEDIYDKIEDIINEEISSPYGLSIQEASEQTTNLFTLLLSSIALISLLTFGYF